MFFQRLTLLSISLLISITSCGKSKSGSKRARTTSDLQVTNANLQGVWETVSREVTGQKYLPCGGAFKSCTQKSTLCIKDNALAQAVGNIYDGKGTVLPSATVTDAQFEITARTLKFKTSGKDNLLNLSAEVQALQADALSLSWKNQDTSYEKMDLRRVAKNVDGTVQDCATTRSKALEEDRKKNTGANKNLGPSGAGDVQVSVNNKSYPLREITGIYVSTSRGLSNTNYLVQQGIGEGNSNEGNDNVGNDNAGYGNTRNDGNKNEGDDGVGTDSAGYGNVGTNNAGNSSQQKEYYLVDASLGVYALIYENSSSSNNFTAEYLGNITTKSVVEFANGKMTAKMNDGSGMTTLEAVKVNATDLASQPVQMQYLAEVNDATLYLVQKAKAEAPSLKVQLAPRRSVSNQIVPQFAQQQAQQVRAIADNLQALLTYAGTKQKLVKGVTTLEINDYTNNKMYLRRDWLHLPAGLSQSADELAQALGANKLELDDFN